MWPSMTSGVIPYLMSKLCLYNVSSHLKFLYISKQKMCRRKSGYLNKKVTLYMQNVRFSNVSIHRFFLWKLAHEWRRYEESFFLWDLEENTFLKKIILDLIIII